MQLGVIGLGTMGANLARNAARNGAKVVVYNRSPEKTDAFMKSYGSEGNIVACTNIAAFRKGLASPRPILLMVKAGKPVDEIILELIPHLTNGDIIIDGGNSHYIDTERRAEELMKLQIRFLGMGVSGGEEGALTGPSMMPGGDRSAYEEIKPLLLKMAAQIEGWKDAKDASADGNPELTRCVQYIGTGGAGHFVKMVHNGIEYAIMQLIAESYDLLKNEAGKSNKELAKTYAAWNNGEDLQSFLMKISAKIFEKKDGGKDLIDLIKDAAGQKGTGKWTTEAAMDYGCAIPTINAAVDARIMSGAWQHRAIAKQSPESIEQPFPHPEELVSRVRVALELSTICAYLQGFGLMQATTTEKGWNLPFAEIARIWRGGCIIRSSFLPVIQRAYETGDRSDIFRRFDGERQLNWRKVIALGAERGIPLPAMGSALTWYDTHRRDKLPQNLIQAQRDFFGAHTYERIDKKGMFHTEWK
jgi:6-phosphogluconate dehydrogenase